MVLTPDVFSLFKDEWALVTAGTEHRFNTMTVSWGSVGTIWGRNVVTVYVKPIRYTHKFLEDNDFFTVSFFQTGYRPSMLILGTKSGREYDKVHESGLTPCPLPNAVTFEEAHTTLLCRKIYRQDMDLAAMPERVVRTFYKGEPPHTMYIGEVLQIIR